MEQELTRLLNTHLQRRPRMQAQDCYKLLYQREFGCGHLAPTLETAVAGLQSEAVQAAELNGTAQLAERAADNTLPGTAEPIGNGLCRIYLDGVWSKEALRLLGRIFCASARTHAGDSARFAAALRLLAHWAQGVLPGTELLALQQIQSTAAANGFFAVHHSQAYRDAYAPHYRVVRQCYADAWPVLLLAQRIREQASAFAPALLAIDGRCGSGKSTLAGHIAEVFACPVFHLDDFFLSPRLRTKERLSFLSVRLFCWRNGRCRRGFSRPVCRCRGQLCATPGAARALCGLYIRHLRARGTAGAHCGAQRRRRPAGF